MYSTIQFFQLVSLIKTLKWCNYVLELSEEQLLINFFVFHIMSQHQVILLFTESILYSET